MSTAHSLRIIGGVAVAALLAAPPATSATIAYQNPAGDYGNQPGAPRGRWDWSSRSARPRSV